MGLLKKYQVTERVDGFWSVFAVGDMKLSEVEFEYLADVSWNKFATAAEAQELADELNKEFRYESNNNA